MPSPRYERLPTTGTTTDDDISISPSPLYDLEDGRRSPRSSSSSLSPTPSAEHNHQHPHQHRFFGWPSNNNNTSALNRAVVFLLLSRAVLLVLLGLLFWLGWRMRNAGWIGAVE